VLVPDRALDAVEEFLRTKQSREAKTYATNWITKHGDSEEQHGTASQQVGTSVAVLRKTYVHVQFNEADWQHIKDFGSP
jgi:hypothetical protein